MGKFTTSSFFCALLVISGCFLSTSLSVGLRLFHIFPNFNSIFMLQVPMLFSIGFFPACFFTCLASFVYDMITYGTGVWTLACIIGYLVINYFGICVFNKVKFNDSAFSRKLVFALISTILFDVITASIGPILFGQDIIQTIIGQVPFTLFHITSNIMSIFLLYPIVSKLFNYYKHSFLVKSSDFLSC